MRIEITKEADNHEIVIWDEDQELLLRTVPGPDGTMRVIHEGGRSAVESSSDIAAAIRELSSTLIRILSGEVRDVELNL